MIDLLAQILTFLIPIKSFRKRLRTQILTRLYGRQVFRTAKVMGKNFYCGGYSYVNKNTELGEHVCFNGMQIHGDGKVKIGRDFHSV